MYIPIKMKKYPFIPARDFSFICPSIFLKEVRKFSTKQMKCRYLHKINEKCRTRINGYFYIKKPFIMGMAFPIQ